MPHVREIDEIMLAEKVDFNTAQDIQEKEISADMVAAHTKRQAEKAANVVKVVPPLPVIQNNNKGRIRIRTIEEIMRDDNVKSRKAAAIQREEMFAFAEARPPMSKEEKYKAIREGRYPGQENNNDNTAAVEPQKTDVVEQLQEPPKFVDPYRGRFVKLNYNLTKDKDRAPLTTYQRTMSDEILNPNPQYTPIPIGEYPSRAWTHTPEPTRGPKGEFLKKRVDANVALSGLPSDAMHYGSENMTDNMFTGMVKRNFGVKTFPEAHTVEEPENFRQARMRNERIGRWLGHGLVPKEDGDTIAYPTPNEVAKPTATKKGSSKNLDEATATLNEGKAKENASLNTKLLKEISNTLKQIQKGMVTPNRKSMFGYLSPWRREQEHDREQDENAMDNIHDGGHHGHGHSPGGNGNGSGGGLLSTIFGVSAANSLLKTVKGLPSKIGSGLARGVPAAEGIAVGGETLGAGVAAGGLAAAGIVALLAPMVIAGMKDDTKVKERQQDLDNTRKEQDKGQAKVAEAPGALKNLVQSGQVDKNQFNKLKSDDEKRSYLYSMGVSKADVEKVLGGESATPIVGGGDKEILDQPNHALKEPPAATPVPGTPYNFGAPNPNEVYSGGSYVGGFHGDPGTATINPSLNIPEPGSEGISVKGQGGTGGFHDEPGTTTEGSSVRGQGGVTQMPSNMPQPSENTSYSKPSVGITGKTFQDKSPQVMQNLMKDFSLTKEQAAGIVGNLGHESGGFTAMQEKRPVVPGSAGGYGWAQWTGPRRQAYFSWAKENNLDVNSDEANYGFLKHELQTNYKGAIDAVKKTNNVGAATVAFEQKYEGAGVKSYGSRENYANQALAATNTQLASASKTDPSQGDAGFKLASANDENKNMASQAATKDAPPVIVQQAAAPQATPGQKSSMSGNKEMAAVRNDDPVFLRAQLGDLKDA